MTEPANLIVNADDYGYFSCVSRGILDCAMVGSITATGVMANSRNFDEQIQWLKEGARLDVGVHLNLTYGAPLTERMRRRLAKWKGQFPGKYEVAILIASHRLPVQDVMEEWRSQINRCRGAGIDIVFLNSHEHLHMLPSLFSAILELAGECNIPYVRYAGPEWQGWRGLAGVSRNIVLQAAHMINRARTPEGTPELLGMSESGKLSFSYLKRRLMSLRAGQVYELMCHPGYFDSREIMDDRLSSYHRWQQELDLLKSSEVRDLCNSLGIRLARFTDICASPGKSGSLRTEARMEG